jgi:hypothetical protein
MQNCAWPGNRTVEIPQNKPLILKYSVIIHRGDAGNEGLKEILKGILDNR